MSKSLDKLRELTATLQTVQHNVQEVLDFLPLCIHTISLDGKITSMNKAGLEMINMKENEVCGLDYMSFAKDKDVLEMKKHWNNAINKGVTTRFDFTATEGNRKFSSCFAPVIVDGEVKKVVGFTLDITNKS